MDKSILLFLFIALGLLAVIKKAGIGSLIAFLFAGIVAGPHVLGIYQISGVWNYLAELGIMFLWFTLGLELNINRLWSMRKNIFGLGAPQVAIVATMLFPILFGMTEWSVMGAVMVSLTLAMSSGGADLQTLADRNELQSKLGRQTFSIILLQDLLSIPLLAMLPIFAGRGFNLGAEIIDVSILTICLVLGAVMFARMFINPIMRIMAKMKSRDAFLVAIMLVIIGCTVIFHTIGLPMAIGAFIAGMLFSETVYKHQVRADIAPYQTMFLTFFFITLGMGLDVPFLAKNVWIVCGGAAGLVIVKFLATYCIARYKKASMRNAFLMALILAQGGEFGLLILQTLRMSGIKAIPFPHTEIVTAVIILSMILTPILLLIYDRLNASGALYSLKKAEKYGAALNLTKKPFVVICGFGRVGKTIAQMLARQKIHYVAIDMNVDQVLSGQGDGFNVVYGDTTRGDVLTRMGLAPRNTKAIIVALDNAAVAKKTVRAAKRVTPRVKIFARARNLDESKILVSEGAKVALPETIESAFLLGHGVMAELGISERDIEAVMGRLRRNEYRTIEK